MLPGDPLFLKRRIASPVAYFTLLSDDEAVEWNVEYGKKPEAEADQIVKGYRQKARKQDVADTVEIHAEVQPGCTFKRNIPQMGPTWKDFKYLQDWDFPDPPTEHSLVSWIPTPLAGSTCKNVFEQSGVIQMFKVEAKLPAWYEVSFGSATHVAGMALAHYKAAGPKTASASYKDPFKNLSAFTETCEVDGNRLDLRWKLGSLCCGSSDWGYKGRDPGFAVFAVGVVRAVKV